MADMSGSKENQGLGLTAKNMVRMLPEPMKRDDGTAAMAQVAAEELERRGTESGLPRLWGRFDDMAGDLLDILAEDLGMSRTPVREALRSLASEGFLEIKNGVGAYVKPLSSKDMENLYEIRCLLEMQAIKTSIYRITDQEIDDMERRFQEVYDACERGEHPQHGEFSNLDWELHVMLVDHCTNPYIKSIVASNDSNLRRYLNLSAEALNNVKESVRQHLEILKVLRTRDLDKLTEVLKTHLDWSENFLRI